MHTTITTNDILNSIDDLNKLTRLVARALDAYGYTHANVSVSWDPAASVHDIYFHVQAPNPYDVGDEFDDSEVYYLKDVIKKVVTWMLDSNFAPIGDYGEHDWISYSWPQGEEEKIHEQFLRLLEAYNVESHLHASFIPINAREVPGDDDTPVLSVEIPGIGRHIAGCTYHYGDVKYFGTLSA